MVLEREKNRACVPSAGVVWRRSLASDNHKPAALPAISHELGQTVASLHSSTYSSESRTEVCVPLPELQRLFTKFEKTKRGGRQIGPSSFHDFRNMWVQIFQILDKISETERRIFTFRYYYCRNKPYCCCVMKEVRNPEADNRRSMMANPFVSTLLMMLLLPSFQQEPATALTRLSWP